MSSLELISILILCFFFVTHTAFLITNSFAIGILSAIFGFTLVILTILRIF